jgi:hypothetical protein
MRARLPSAKNSGIGTVPAMVLRKRSVSRWFARSAPNSSCSCAEGASSCASFYVNSYIGRTAAFRRCS